MCGIVGVIERDGNRPVEAQQMRQMLALLRHRGPDQFGIFLDQGVGLGSARLSIIDLSSGQQPIGNEDGTLWIVFNGEIFNYVELRPQLEARGHQFSTNSDTEVILHLYEDYGPDCLQYMNGQFAIAIWDTHRQELFLARDRLGIRPLFYSRTSEAFIFGSEIKALLADPRLQAEIDPLALDQIFTYWSTLSPRTVFKDIFEVPAGHYARLRGDQFDLQPYWSVSFPDAQSQPPFSLSDRRKVAEYQEQFQDLLIDATRIRLRADVPVGAYLSGGLDSSATAAIIRNYTRNQLDTFSIAFEDADFDESLYQYRMADFLGTDHQVVKASDADIGQAFLQAVWHTETPILRTSPAPLYLLSRLVRENNYKVVMTGEGADEFLAGYNIFKEARVRRFWARHPESQIRPLLLQKLYPYISSLSGSGNYIRSFFGYRLTETSLPEYSHLIRWHNTARTKRFIAPPVLSAAGQQQSGPLPLQLPADFSSWDPLNQAQYLEITIFLSQYLLSSQGDRMGMANSVEGRFPFLDYRVVEFCNNLPVALKLNGLTEKYLLKQTASQWLPDEIWRRPKRPYRAPIQRSFFNPHLQEQVDELLSEQALSSAGYFKPAAVRMLAEKAASTARLSETDEMALAGILSTQQVHKLFIGDLQLPRPLNERDDVKTVDLRRVTNR